MLRSKRDKYWRGTAVARRLFTPFAQVYASVMNENKSNIEAVARTLCERELRAISSVAEDLSPLVDRYWHCVAAELEAGLIDTNGDRLVPYEFESSRDAYRDWCQRHRPEQPC